LDGGYCAGALLRRPTGLKDKATLELRDYTKVDDAFDKIASIGMFEHVGAANYQTYFETVHRLLKPGGLYLRPISLLASRGC